MLNEMSKSQLLDILSDNSLTKYDELLVECMNKYHKNSTRDLTDDELREFIMIKKIGGDYTD